MAPANVPQTPEARHNEKCLPVWPKRLNDKTGMPSSGIASRQNGSEVTDSWFLRSPFQLMCLSTIIAISQLLRMVFHSRVTNSHRCHDRFQLPGRTEFRNDCMQNGNQLYRPIPSFQHTRGNCIGSSYSLF